MIDIQDLTVAFNTKTPVLSIDNLSIPKGQFVVICGKSGCGKTTLTQCLNGLLPITHPNSITGYCKVGDHILGEASLNDFSEKIASVFQQPRTQFFTTQVDDELTFAAQNLGLTKKDILQKKAEAIDLFDLSPLLNRSMFDLSGGEKQIVACAAAYIQNPELIILDEPSSNLDFDNSNKLKKILHLIKKTGTTVIISEHRLSYLADLADRFLILEKGQIISDCDTSTFISLGEEKRQALGLRTLDLTTLTPQLLPGFPSDTQLQGTELSARFYGKPLALSIDSVSFNSGEVTTLMGHNGAGKSTLISCLAGLKRFKTGKVFYQEKQLKKKARTRQSVLVMQDVSLQFFFESVKQELIFNRPDKVRLKEAIDLFDLAHLLNHHPRTLSGGEKQRVALATAYLSDKPIVILDEPSSGLDYYHLVRVAQAINDLKKAGKTVILITHDLELLALTTDRILELNHGQILENTPLTAENFNLIVQTL